MMTMKVCSNCGHQQPATSSYCSQCGSLMPGLETGALPPNSTLQGRYVIHDTLGQGGMAAVYRATDQRIRGKSWAIKEMSDAAIADAYEKAQAIAAFEQEAQLLARLDHANIPKVTDFFTENHKHYIVMEFVPGETLEERTERLGVPCNEQEVREWTRQLFGVLSYLHNQTPPIIFRDLKPGNIMLTPQGELKLIDFGIARLFQGGKVRDTQVIGTPGYASPEQHGHGQTDPRSDVYSLGVVLHHLLTLHDPATTPFNLPPVRQLNPSVSANLEQLIAKATQHDSSQRYQSIDEMRLALGGPPPRSQQTGQPVVGSLPWAALAGLTLCVVLMLGLGVVLAVNVVKPTPTSAVVVAPPASSRPTHTPTSTVTTEAPPSKTPTSTPTEWPTSTNTPTRTPTPTRRPTSTPTLDWAAFEAAIIEVVREYGEVKVEATTYLDPSRLADVLIYPVLERQNRSVCWLRNEGMYYVYGDRSLDIEDVTFDDDRHATLVARISENRVLHKQDGSVQRDYGRDTYRAIYQLERRGGNRWYIYCFQALEGDDPVQCTVELEGADPCSE